MTMKRLMLVWVMILCLVPLGAWAEETAPALYPIRENGLWGYMNRAGETVIQPQWIEAHPFNGNAAIVKAESGEGLILRNGEMLLIPEYCFAETMGGGLSYWKWDPTEEEPVGLQGFYDPASGCLLPPCYDRIYDYDGEDLLIMVDTSGDSEKHYGFIRRSTVEVVVPFVFDGLYDDAGFSEGYVLAAWERGFQGDGFVWGPDYHLYDLEGHETVFDNGIKPDSCVSNGVLRIVRVLDDEEAALHPSGWGSLYGLGRPDGTIVAEPQYDYLQYSGEGLFDIYQDERHGLMDSEGHVIVQPKYHLAHETTLPQITYRNGYAVIEAFIPGLSETDESSAYRIIILNSRGHEIFSYMFPENEWISLGNVMPNGLLWYRKHDMYGLMKVAGDTVEYLTDAVFESHFGGYFQSDGLNFIREQWFSEGTSPVRQNGLWGYIDETAQWVILPQFDDASPFRDGLALVEKDGKLMYIDNSGVVVWEEP